MAEFHINVGIAALARGFITLEGFAQGMQALATSRAQTIEELWVEKGIMSVRQLEAVLDTLGTARGRDTMLFANEGAPSSARAAGIPDTEIPQDPTTRVAKKSERRSMPHGSATAPTAASLVPEKEGSQRTSVVTFKAPPSGLEHPSGGSRYQRLFKLGSGGLGDVDACEDLVLNRTVAVKVSHQKGDVDQDSSKLILAREARIISSLEHPNIIPIYDAGTDPERGPYYVMRQVSDKSLELILHQRKNGEGDAHEYTLHRLLRYFLQVCNAVDYAHHRGVIHCDIKPANILLGEYGEVLLVDWGLAQSRNHPFGVRGGTLGYMAPEQMDVMIEAFDERTDVFALGAILYEILSGRAAFEAARQCDIAALGSNPTRIYRTPAEPSSFGDEEIPPEVIDICMRAIAVEREHRLANVRLLSVAIDEYIEGSKQKERQLVEADKSADAGDELAERYHEFVESRPEKVTVFRALRADIAPWAPVDEKQDEWDAEDIIRVTDALQVRTLHSAVSAYERALDCVPKHVRARRGLARLYYAELERARKRGDALEMIACEQMLREVDDGTYVRELQKDGDLELHIAPDVGRVTLAKLVESQRRLVEAAPEVIEDRPTVHRALAAGRYVVSAMNASRGGRVSWPLNLDAGARCTLDIRLPPGDVLGEDEVFVPAGPARLGGDPLSSESEESHVIDVPAFVIQRFPLTFAEWFEFLDYLRAMDPTLVKLHVPRATLGMPTWQFQAGEWKPDASVPSARVEKHLLPVFGVSAESAEAFARWRSQRDGHTWRLPTEHEWEKAARGTDGRVYPWGDHFDATFCKMRDSRPGLPLVEPIGTFEHDVSPYGVRDLAGGVADWCIPDPRRNAPREPRDVVARGGAWCDWAIDCRLASRRRYLATEHSARVGVRLARDP